MNAQTDAGNTLEHEADAQHLFNNQQLSVFFKYTYSQLLITFEE